MEDGFCNMKTNNSNIKMLHNRIPLLLCRNKNRIFHNIKYSKMAIHNSSKATKVDDQGDGLNQRPLIGEDVHSDGEGNDGQQVDHHGRPDSEEEPNPLSPFHDDENIDVTPLKQTSTVPPSPHQQTSPITPTTDLAENNMRRVAGLPPFPPKKKPPPGKEPYVFKDPPYFNRTRLFRSRQAKKTKGQSGKSKQHIDISDDNDEDEFHFPTGE
ncbi:hypothetical protein ACLOJK_017674 [Asimina triloba]